MPGIYEVIESIEEVQDNGYSGWSIKTPKQTIKILIESGQKCCEDWGYIITEDKDYKRFIGWTISAMDIIETEDYKTISDVLSNMSPVGDRGYAAVFINLHCYKFNEETRNNDTETIQFVVFNGHNGYYGHDIKIESNKLMMEDTL